MSVAIVKNSLPACRKRSFRCPLCCDWNGTFPPPLENRTLLLLLFPCYVSWLLPRLSMYIGRLTSSRRCQPDVNKKDSDKTVRVIAIDKGGGILVPVHKTSLAFFHGWWALAVLPFYFSRPAYYLRPRAVGKKKVCAME